jgi:lipopolysaccharide export LptBFGC system permease protein LptF
MPWFKRQRSEEDKLKTGLRDRARKALAQGDEPPSEPVPAPPQASPALPMAPEPAAPIAQTELPAKQDLSKHIPFVQGLPTPGICLPETGAAPVQTPDAVRQPALEPQPPAAIPPEPPPPPATSSVPRYHAHAASRDVPMMLAGSYSGLDLTLFIGKRGRAVGFRGRPLPLQGVSVAYGKTFYGRHLTLHRNKKGSCTPLHTLSHFGAPRRMSPWLALWIALRWLFSWRIKILVIERYIFGEAIGYFLLGAMGFTFFMIVTSVFSLGEKIFSKHIPPFTITKVLLLSAPAFLVLAIPVAVLFSTLMAMGRLNRDNEIVAMSTNGISLYRLFIPFITISIIAGLMTWMIYENVVPPNNRQYKDVLKVFWEAQVTQFIKPQIVIKAPQKKYFYVEWIDKVEGIMYNLRLYDYYGEGGQPRHFPRMYIAERAWVADGYLVLSKVRLYNLDPNTGDTMVSAAMPEVKIDIGTQLSDYNPDVHPTEMTASELRLRIQMNRDRLSSMGFMADQLRQYYYRDWTEYYFKYSIPVACLVLVLVAVPVSLRGPRDERNLGIILSFMLLMVYYVIYFSCRVLGSRGPSLNHDLVVGGKTLLLKGTNMFPPMVAGWLPAALFFIWALYLIWRARK